MLYRALAHRAAARAAIAALIAVLISYFGPAKAESPPALRFCPPTVIQTCYFGYVTSAGRMVVLLSSMDNDTLVGKEVDVSSSAPGTSAVPLDLSKQVGSVVMLDATGNDHIGSARIMSVADPLLTALYLSVYLQPPSESNLPK